MPSAIKLTQTLKRSETPAPPDGDSPGGVAVGALTVGAVGAVGVATGAGVTAPTRVLHVVTTSVLASYATTRAQTELVVAVVATWQDSSGVELSLAQSNAFSTMLGSALSLT